jgi:hypothetical protein
LFLGLVEGQVGRPEYFIAVAAVVGIMGHSDADGVEQGEARWNW